MIQFFVKNALGLLLTKKAVTFKFINISDDLYLQFHTKAMLIISLKVFLDTLVTIEMYNGNISYLS